ncbi:transcription regulator protein [Advenella kashmirensis W13003]|uniref:Transcription regulator protein n=1 Tax=Advenella kashmirensis W13003 TaxID=1424334 RepID=V8QXL9_9BURK|nr:LysR family transcriptional regulator [Advenella kashmirensis]ETF04093.1 transcription regulator protein [Advenella kashmirensis W13003]
MNTMECIEVFVEVAKGLSFTKAAERLGTSRSVISKKIAWLEQTFETQLLQRNTKRVSLTESGEILLRNADSVSRAVTELKDLVRSTVQQPTGKIRVGSPPSFGAVHLAPAIQVFLETYPAVHVTMQLDDGRSDLIAENMDLTVRIAPRLEDTSQIAYKIAVVPQVLVATDAYLDRAGWPAHPTDLKRHNCLVHTLKTPSSSWQFTDTHGQLHRVQVSGSFTSNLGESLRHLAQRHYGISLHPRYMVEELIAAGGLRVVLPEYQCEGLDIYAVIQSKRYLPYKVRLFIAHLRNHFKDTNWTSSTIGNR